MGVFFTKSPMVLPQDPSPKAGVPSAPGTFSWVRLVIAISLLLGVLIACVYAGTRAEVGAPPKNPLEPLFTLLLHSFELLLGAVIGLLTGESIHNQSS